MTKYLSDKIRKLSFLSIIAVFIIHTRYVEEEPTLSYFIQQIFHTLANFAVPFFFVISGYLFFLNKKDLLDIKKGIQRRILTLLIPYILWCSLFLGQLWIASQFTTLNHDYFDILRQGNIILFIKRAYIAPPIAFHLWYVRDLICLVLISPVLWIFQRKHPLLSLMLVCLLCGLIKFIPWLSWPLTWFCIGSYYAFTNKELLKVNNKFIGPLCLLFYCIVTILLIRNNLFTTANQWFSFPLILLGIYGIWNCYDLFNLHRYIPNFLTGHTFFLYCGHVPFLTIVATLIFPIIADNQLLSCVGYFFPTIITCAVLLIIVNIWKRLNRHCKIADKVYRILMGGR